MRNPVILFSFSILISCTQIEEEPVIGLPVLTSLVAYDYGNTGTSKDILLGVTFATQVVSQVKVQAIIAKMNVNLTLEESISLSNMRYSVINIVDKSFRGSISNEINDSDGDAVVDYQPYQVYLLISDENSRMSLSEPSVALVLKEKEILDVYTLTQSVTGHNQYLLDEKTVLSTKLSPSLDMIFDKNGKILILTATGGVMEYSNNGVFQKEVISSNLISDPKAMRVGPDGDLYIIDGSSLVRFNRIGEFIEVYLKDLISPGSLAWDQNGRLYITEKIKRGRILTFDNSKNIINEFAFFHPSIVPKSVSFNEAEQKIYINRTSINGTGIVSLDPDTFEWLLLGSLELFGTFSDSFVNNQAGHTLIVREDGLNGPELVVVVYADTELKIIEKSAPLKGLPTGIALGPKND